MSDMNEKHDDLIKRIDDYMQGASEELGTVILADCRAALSKKYVPMTDDERAEMMARWYENKDSRDVLSKHIEAEVIRRAGLEVRSERRN